MLGKIKKWNHDPSLPGARLIVSDFKYLRIRDKQHAELLTIQLQFLGYKLEITPKYNNLTKAGYLLIDKEGKTVIHYLRKEQAKKLGFPENYCKYDEITIEEITRGDIEKYRD